MKVSELTWRQALRTIDGVSFPVIQRIGDNHLVDMTVFEDGLIEAPELMDLAMFEADVRKGRIGTAIPEGETLRLGLAGLLDLEQGDWTLTPDALIGELRECGRELRGEPTSFHVCRAAADAYWADPTDENLATLRRTYEEVPPHLRRYCGDMDEKDIPIRKVLYGDSMV